jgi:ANTAR domain/GAF domain
MSGNEGELTAERLQDLLLESPGFQDFLLGLSTISASLLGGDVPMLCAVTVEEDGGPSTVASSADEALRLDEKQYYLGNGPCLEALRGQHTVLIRDLQSDKKWSAYASAVAAAGIRSVLAVPIATDPSSRAALNCYARTVDNFSDDRVARITAHAASISSIMRLALRIHTSDPYPPHLRSALRSREIVDAAVSLIMLQNRCGRDHALKILQLAARTKNRGLHEIAADLLTGNPRSERTAGESAAFTPEWPAAGDHGSDG